MPKCVAAWAAPADPTNTAAAAILVLIMGLSFSRSCREKVLAWLSTDPQRILGGPSRAESFGKPFRKRRLGLGERIGTIRGIGDELHTGKGVGVDGHQRRQVAVGTVD